jgi:uncharacterized protein YggT (Ycf19 family)
MNTAALLLVSILRAIVEIAMLSLLGQGLLALLAGNKREANPIYQLFRVVTGPATRLIGKLAPRQIMVRHLPFVTFFVLFWVWILLAYIKGNI